MAKLSNPASSDERLVVISADCHGGASILGYREYLPKHWHAEFDEWTKEFSDPWTEVDEHEIQYGVASFESEISWDHDLRQKVLEGDGIVGEVIFPNTAPPFFPSGVLTVAVPKSTREYERRMAGIRAHNTWLAEFCNALPGRRAGIAQVFLNNIDDTLAEVRRIADLGLKSILLPADTAEGLVPLYLPRYEPLWELCAELGVVPHKHGNYAGHPNTTEFGPAAGLIGMLEGMTWNRRGLAHLLMSGVFERHPDLKFVYTEVGASWVPDYLAGCDAIYRSALEPGSATEYFGGPAARALPKAPSEYYKTNVRIGASFMSPAESAMRDQIGVDRLMWGSDLPHSEGTHPFTTEALRAVFGDVPLAETKQILSGNAIDVYGFDVPVLEKAAAEFGPLASVVSTPLTAAEWPKNPGQTTCPTFAGGPPAA